MILLTPRRDGGRQGSPVTAGVLPLPDALEPLVEYFRSVSGEHSDWDEYRAAMTKQGKALIRITPQRWGPVATGGFPTYPAEG